MDVWGIDLSDDTMAECGGADTGVELTSATTLPLALPFLFLFLFYTDIVNLKHTIKILFAFKE